MKKKTESGKETRLRLILIAGELFAEKGFKEASIRTIAKKAKVNIAAVNYHFSSKENLYFESILYVMEKVKIIIESPILSAKKNRKPSPKEISDAIYNFININVKKYLSLDIPRWYMKLILGCLMKKTPILQKLYQQFFHPNHTAFKALIKMSNPKMTDRKASLWAKTIIGQIIFYAYAREPILIELGMNHFSKEFINSVIEHISNLTLLGLGLPKVSKSKKSMMQT